MERAEALRNQALRLLDEAARLDALPKDDFEHGDVIMWQRRFGTKAPSWANNIAYTYVAVKIGVSWYMTGANRNLRHTWDDLVRDHLSYAEGIWYVTEWTELPHGL